MYIRIVSTIDNRLVPSYKDFDLSTGCSSRLCGWSGNKTKWDTTPEVISQYLYRHMRYHTRSDISVAPEGVYETRVKQLNHFVMME